MLQIRVTFVRTGSIVGGLLFGGEENPSASAWFTEENLLASSFQVLEDSSHFQSIYQ